jgi:hypothetical protein
MNDTRPRQRRKDLVMRSMESLPTQMYWGLAMGAVLLSALFFLIGRRDSALFVGQWPPTFLALALLYKLLRPRQEAGGVGARDVMHEVGATAN